ncbi:MAG: hypothetical protein FJ149_10690 [Euryarchaeota archaeon]|nr:hypothetical protein [Euryarchaeota archaeon]
MPQRSGGKPATEPVSCCAAAAAANLEYLLVGGHRVAISRLAEILERAQGASSQGEGAVRRELVCLARVHNYIPPPAEKDYEEALYAEYLARKGKARQGKGAGGRR